LKLLNDMKCTIILKGDKLALKRVVQMKKGMLQNLNEVLAHHLITDEAEVYGYEPFIAVGVC
ncbi:MAG: hypothetical protein ACJ8MO_04865, partial [Bacillus sp. (in: firmicutes)]